MDFGKFSLIERRVSLGLLNIKNVKLEKTKNSFFVIVQI